APPASRGGGSAAPARRGGRTPPGAAAAPPAPGRAAAGRPARRRGRGAGRKPWALRLGAAPGGGRAGERRLLPLPLPGQPLVQPALRLPPEVAAELAGVGEGVPLVPGPGRLAADGERPAGQGLELAEHVEHADRLAAAEVV